MQVVKVNEAGTVRLVLIDGIYCVQRTFPEAAEWFTIATDIKPAFAKSTATKEETAMSAWNAFYSHI